MLTMKPIARPPQPPRPAARAVLVSPYLPRHALYPIPPASVRLLVSFPGPPRPYAPPLARVAPARLRVTLPPRHIADIAKLFNSGVQVSEVPL